MAYLGLLAAGCVLTVITSARTVDADIRPWILDWSNASSAQSSNELLRQVQDSMSSVVRRAPSPNMHYVQDVFVRARSEHRHFGRQESAALRTWRGAYELKTRMKELRASRQQSQDWMRRDIGSRREILVRESSKLAELDSTITSARSTHTQAQQARRRREDILRTYMDTWAPLLLEQRLSGTHQKLPSNQLEGIWTQQADQFSSLLAQGYSDCRLPAPPTLGRTNVGRMGEVNSPRTTSPRATPPRTALGPVGSVTSERAPVSAYPPATYPPTTYPPATSTNPPSSYPRPISSYPNGRGAPTRILPTPTSRPGTSTYPGTTQPGSTYPSNAYPVVPKQPAPIQPYVSQPVIAPTAPTRASGTFQWYYDWNQAAAAARAIGGVVLVFATRPTCSQCKVVRNTVIPANQHLLNGRAVGFVFDMSKKVNGKFGGRFGTLVRQNLPGAQNMPLAGFTTPDLQWINGFWGQTSSTDFAQKARAAVGRRR